MDSFEGWFLISTLMAGLFIAASFFMIVVGMAGVF